VTFQQYELRGRSRQARRISSLPITTLAGPESPFLLKVSLQMLTIVLLTVSNVFMTIAWYGHLKHKESPLLIAILVSWLIAFVEYCFQVPANRWGSAHFSAVQLKVIQEIITLVVFSVFAVWYLEAKLGWNHLAAFLLIVGAVFLVRSDVPTQAAPVVTEQPKDTGN
jgi:uncharacterized protein (DUF486 family)